jgi:cytochrome c biogenesis protein CcmG, thiol:disulfide interchange protein DsbE
MKKVVLLLLILVVGFAGVAQDKMPAVVLRTLNGKEMNTGSLSNGEQYLIISFWATWCKPCMQELDAISEQFDSWPKAKKCKVIAISIDDSRSFNSVKSLVTGRGWEFDVFLDANQDFKRALNISNIPHTIIVNPAGQIIKRINGYTPGEEKKLMNYIQ